MRNIAALVVAVLMTFFTARYIWLTVRSRIEPTLATWLIFSTGTTLSLASYIATGRYSVVSNIANFVDVLMTWLIAITVACSRGRAAAQFSRSEIGCLAGAASIICFWVATGDHRAANLAVQILLLVGYLPTVKRLWRADANTESPGIWLVVWVAAAISLYPPVRDEDRLATIYAARALIAVSLLPGLIIRAHRRIRQVPTIYHPS